MSKNKRTKIVDLPEFKDVQAYLRCISGEGTSKVKGYGVISKSRDRADGCRNHVATVHGKDWVSAENEVIRKITEDLRRQRSSPQPASAAKGFFVQRLSIAREILDREVFNGTAIGISLLSQMGWIKETYSSTFSYLIRTLAPYMDKAYGGASAPDLSEIHKHAAEKAVKSKKSRHNSELARSSTGRYIYRCRKLYNFIRDSYPDLGLPEMVGELPRSFRVIEPEMVKELPQDIRVILACALWQLAKQGCVLAYGAMMMLWSGLRTAEAMAPLMEEFELDEEKRFGIYTVRRQIKSGSKAVEQLKTDAAYRSVVLPCSAFTFVKLRRTQLSALGYSDSEIDTLPLVSRPGAIHEFIHPSQLSAFVRRLLLICGYSKEAFDTASKIMFTERDPLDGDLGMDDTSAYILRRDFASRCCNICGIEPSEVDLLIGHKGSEKNAEYTRKILSVKEAMCQVARKMDSFVSFPESWNSPGIRPVHLTGDASFVDSGGTDYYFVADEDIHINFSVRTSEPNDSLSAELPVGWDKNCLGYSAIAMTAGDKFSLCLSIPLEKPEYYLELNEQGKRAAEKYLAEFQEKAEGG